MKVSIFVFLGIMMTAGFCGARPEIILPGEAEVSAGSTLTLFQVAEFNDFTPEALRELTSIPLLEKTEAGSTATISGAEISRKVRELVRDSELLKKLSPSVRIPSEIRLQVRGDGISKSETERIIKNLVASRCPGCTLQVRVNSLPKVRGADWSIDWEQEIKSGSFMIPVRESAAYSNKWISGTLRVQKKVPVAKKLIRYGERLQIEDVEILQTDVSFVKEVTPELSQIVGLVANRTLTPRAPILLSDLKREPAARKGQVVKALVGENDFEVSINASAEENGFIGDSIKIKNPETQKTMSAVVIDKGVVKVQ